MTLFDQFSNVLRQYSGGSNPDPAQASEHFDQVAPVAPQGDIAEGLSSVFPLGSDTGFWQSDWELVQAVEWRTESRTLEPFDWIAWAWCFVTNSWRRRACESVGRGKDD